MRVERQLSVFLENKPGTLARMCEALAESGINMMAMSVSDTVDHAVVRMVVDKPDEALHLLGSSGVLVIENEVVLVDVPNRPGGLAVISRLLADNHINIEYAYCTATGTQSAGMLVLRTRDPEHALRVLRES